MLNGYLSVAIFFGLILAFAVVSLVGAWVVRPARPSASKSENYECGAQPIGEAWVQFPVGFYLVALVFLVFDTLAVFLFPWALTMRITALNLFRKPVTVHYPETTRRFPDRFRGLLALTYDPETGEENCIGCRLCEFICPPAVIKVEMLKAEKRNYAKTFTLELYACEFCELCVQVCPTDAIIMMKSFDLATADRREMLLDKDRLHVIGLQHAASWATGNKLRDMIRM